jgi:hypothetical protein
VLRPPHSPPHNKISSLSLSISLSANLLSIFGTYLKKKDNFREF